MISATNVGTSAAKGACKQERMSPAPGTGLVAGPSDTKVERSNIDNDRALVFQLELDQARRALGAARSCVSGPAPMYLNAIEDSLKQMELVYLAETDTRNA